MPATNEVINVVVLRDVPQADLDRIEAVAPGRIRATGIWRGVRDELAKTFPEEQLRRFERTTEPVPAPPAEVTAKALAQAQVLYSGAVHPADLIRRMPNLRWAHFTMAGVSTIRPSEFWGSHIPVTSSRGHTAALPIAELAMAGGMALAKAIPTAVRQTGAQAFDPRAYMPKMISGKTLGVIGLGGIGQHLARIGKGLGMRVLGSKRSAAQRGPGEDRVDEVFPASELHQMLAQCDFVGVCAPLTRETENLLDETALAACKQGVIIMNIARGEIIHEPALIAALASGHVAGAYMDVYTGEEDGQPPNPELLAQPNVVLTPHIGFKSDVSHMFAMDLFRDNLRRFVAGEPLVNVIDWERGY